jgi:hypothetical protein
VTRNEAEQTCSMVLEVVAYLAASLRDSTRVTVDEDMKPYVEQTEAQRRKVA